ncbi:hypothetical protein Bca52824_027044 [Brassica carinata]|uniref:Uncharacterized protein n=1 Tax=Brassica carinata TaxID=52824 RepID=A0A8X7VAE5_BRACI|nr:hypothetical protein Bca52824_027044 [Brassica carinata]
MDSIEAPSFSLGFDLDAASYPKPGLTGDDEPEPELTVSDSDLELGPGSSSPALKRLRRGFNDINKCSAVDDASELLGRTEDRDDDEDDIEEFSSPEDAPASTKSHFSSCTSRVSLRGSGIFTSQPPSSSISRSLEKRKRLDDVPVSTGSGTTSVAPLFQSSNTSPLRRFQLLESDSEDDHPSKRSRDSIRVTETNDPSSERKEPGSLPTRSPLRRLQILDSDSEDDCPFTREDLSRVTKTNSSCSKVQPSVASKPKRNELGDLWKDFSPAAVSKIQTPALDDVCQDYFSSIKKNIPQKQSSAVASSSNSGLLQQNEHFFDSSHPTPPSHRFFLHSDPRIQNLARKRLPNFLPLGIFNDRENRREECLIDYMNQFGSNGSSKTGASSSKSCRGWQTKSKVSKGQESSKASSAVPKDAGRRRVSANTGSAGHWFTSAEGRKVFISKSGQEFSGQSAYRCYKKETGGGFNKSRKKRQPKKKAKK